MKTALALILGILLLALVVGGILQSVAPDNPWGPDDDDDDPPFPPHV